MFSIQVMESENTMPPIAAPTPQSLYQDFEIKYKDWSQSSFHCLSELREDREISMKMTNKIINGYESVQESGLSIQDLEPDHANLFPYLTSQMEGVKILWKICLLKLFKGRSVEELEADVRNHFRYENDGKKVPALNTDNAVEQVVETTMDKLEPECHVRSDEEQENNEPEVLPQLALRRLRQPLLSVTAISVRCWCLLSAVPAAGFGCRCCAVGVA